MIFIGYYPIGSYKLYDPKGKMIVIIRDVILDESKWWDRLLKQGGKSPVFLKVDWDKWVDEDEEQDNKR